MGGDLHPVRQGLAGTQSCDLEVGVPSPSSGCATEELGNLGESRNLSGLQFSYPGMVARTCLTHDIRKCQLRRKSSLCVPYSCCSGLQLDSEGIWRARRLQHFSFGWARSGKWWVYFRSDGLTLAPRPEAVTYPGRAALMKRALPCHWWQMLAAGP